MYEPTHKYKLEQSVSNLFNNLDILVENEEQGLPRNSFLTVSKTQVNVLHCHHNGKSTTLKVLNDNVVNKCQVLQAKWCLLNQQTTLVITSYNGLMIFDGEGQLLMFWHNLCDASEENSSSIFCRGITCVQKKYICVGTSSGKVLVITPHKNSFSITHTLDNHTEPISVLSGLQQTSSKQAVDFVSADDSGLLCSYNSGSKFNFVSHLSGDESRAPCTSLELLQNGWIIGGYSNGKIRIFDSAQSVLLADISAHVRAVSGLDSIALANSSYLIVSVSEDSFIRVWKVSCMDSITVTQEWYTSQKDVRICGVRFCDPSGKTFITTGYDDFNVVQFSLVH